MKKFESYQRKHAPHPCFNLFTAEFPFFRKAQLNTTENQFQLLIKTIGTFDDLVYIVKGRIVEKTLPTKACDSDNWPEPQIRSNKLQSI